MRGGSDFRSQLGRWPSIGSDAHNRFGGTCPLLFTHVPHRHYGFAEATNSPNYIVECTSLLWIPPHLSVRLCVRIGLVPPSRCSGRVVLIAFVLQGCRVLNIVLDPARYRRRSRRDRRDVSQGGAGSHSIRLWSACPEFCAAGSDEFPSPTSTLTAASSSQGSSFVLSLTFLIGDPQRRQLGQCGP